MRSHFFTKKPVSAVQIAIFAAHSHGKCKKYVSADSLESNFICRSLFRTILNRQA